MNEKMGFHVYKYQEYPYSKEKEIINYILIIIASIIISIPLANKNLNIYRDEFNFMVYVYCLFQLLFLPL